MQHTLIAYQPNLKRQWDKAVRQARNGHFLFERDYMDYHADRFADCSFLLYRGENLVALLPAHRSDEELVSHGGLTFGGWIQMPACLHVDLRIGFCRLAESMRAAGLKRLVYIPAPHPYFKDACESDVYALTELGAQPSTPRLGAFIRNPGDLSRNTGFRRRLRRAEEAAPGQVIETTDIATFWRHLERFLEYRHNASPIHSTEEMQLLQGRFPKNIRLFVLKQGADWLGGELVFLSQQVLRLQYGFYTKDRPEVKNHLRTQEWIRSNLGPGYAWMDLGTSNDPASRELIDSLHLHKEIFGARGIVMNSWKWEP